MQPAPVIQKPHFVWKWDSAGEVPTAGDYLPGLNPLLRMYVPDGLITLGTILYDHGDFNMGNLRQLLKVSNKKEPIDIFDQFNFLHEADFRPLRSADIAIFLNRFVVPAAVCKTTRNLDTPDYDSNDHTVSHARRLFNFATSGETQARHYVPGGGIQRDVVFVALRQAKGDPVKGSYGTVLIGTLPQTSADVAVKFSSERYKIGSEMRVSYTDIFTGSLWELYIIERLSAIKEARNYIGTSYGAFRIVDTRSSSPKTLIFAQVLQRLDIDFSSLLYLECDNMQNDDPRAGVISPEFKAIVCYCIYRALEIIDFLAQLNVYHLDLYPPNIMCRVDDRNNVLWARAVDFGISCIADPKWGGELAEQKDLMWRAACRRAIYGCLYIAHFGVVSTNKSRLPALRSWDFFKFCIEKISSFGISADKAHEVVNFIKTYVRDAFSRQMLVVRSQSTSAAYTFDFSTLLGRRA